MNQKHLSDDRLIEICLAGSAAPGAEPHLVSCAECELRRATLTRMLDDISESAVAEADAAFPADRLARQQARILHRIELEGRPGRVIAFPAGQAQEPAVLRTRPASRWVAGAAAAGLVIGLLAGHLAHDLPGSVRAAPAPQIVSNKVTSPTSGGALRPVSATLSDDEFLGQVELALGSNGPAALRPLDVLTPRAWDVAAQ
jgi:hypothetical protein